MHLSYFGQDLESKEKVVGILAHVWLILASGGLYPCLKAGQHTDSGTRPTVTQVIDSRTPRICRQATQLNSYKISCTYFLSSPSTARIVGY